MGMFDFLRAIKKQTGILLPHVDWSGSKDLAGARTYVRQGEPLGVYTQAFEDYIFREVNPWLYEAIREAVGPIDGAINRLVTLDGILKFETDSDRILHQLEDFADNVQVNDMEQGLQAFYRSQGNELYEQGHGIGEFVIDATKARDVTQLIVADSKGTYFKRTPTGLEVWYAPPGIARGRRDGTDQIERVLRNTYNTSVPGLLERGGYTQLDRRTLVYAGFNNEADGPYGVSLLRSTEFDAKTLLVMKNAVYQTWQRWGDPIFNVVLKKKTRKDETELLKDQANLAANIAKVMEVKRSGNSADLVNVIGKDDELEIRVLGADGQVLEIEMPARHILEQIVSKTGLPPWMMGMQWSTSERLAQRQGDIAISESKTRFALRKPGITQICVAALRARGITWKPREWQLVQDLPSLQDLVAKAQAAFLTAQTDLMQNGSANNAGNIDPAKVLNIVTSGDTFNPIAFRDNVIDTVKTAINNYIAIKTEEGGHPCKVEAYVEDEAALLKLESIAEKTLLSSWGELLNKVLKVLLPSRKIISPIFIFDATTMHTALIELRGDFVDQVGDENGSFMQSIKSAWEIGELHGSTELATNRIAETVRATLSREQASAGLKFVSNATVRMFGNDVLLVLEEGGYNGMNYADVARQLKKRFDVENYNWKRLAHSEIAAAQAQGKMEQYKAHGLSLYDIKRAGGACPICIGLAENGPYPVGQGPMPVRDTHPNCRCTTTAYLKNKLT